MFDAEAKPTRNESRAVYKVSPRYCPCPEGQRQLVRDEARLQRREWARQARQIVFSLEVGKYADFRFKTWDPDQNGQNSADVVKSVLSYADDVIARRTKRWLWLHGDYGLGKTHLGIAALRQIAAKNLWPQMVAVWPDHCSRVKDSFGLSPGQAGDTSGKLWSKMRSAKILLIDDIDKVDTTGWAIQKLYEVIDHRLIRQRTTIITANHSISELRGLWRSSEKSHIRDTGSAILSRIEGEVYALVKFAGEDQRRQ
jgi:DNA replication protein DnaC